MPLVESCLVVGLLMVVPVKESKRCVSVPERYYPSKCQGIGLGEGRLNLCDRFGTVAVLGIPL